MNVLIWVVASLGLGVLTLSCSSTGTGGGGGGFADGGAAEGGAPDGAAGSGGGQGGTGGGGTGGTGGGTGGGGTADCQSACDSLAAAACPEQRPTVECVSECEAEIGGATQCATQAAALLSCISTTTHTCTAQGTVDVLAVCRLENTTMASCVACSPSALDDACDTCSKTSCCTERRTFYGDASFLDYVDCITACLDPACAGACDEQYPSTGQALQALVTCQLSCPAC